MLLVFEYNGANGSLHRLQEFSSLPVDFYGDNTASEVAVAPSGRFVYVGNRGDNSIAAFVVDEARTVTPGGYFLTGGRIPRHFAIEPGGHWMVVANQESDNLVAFRIEHEFGELEPAGYEASVPAPTCVVFV